MSIRESTCLVSDCWYTRGMHALEKAATVVADERTAVLRTRLSMRIAI